MSVFSADSLPATLRKCPIHNAWIKVNKQGGISTRYCPVCLTQKLKEEAQVFKDAGTEKPKIRIITI